MVKAWVSRDKPRAGPLRLRPRSRTLQEPQVERREHKDNPDIREQPCQEVVPEEQHVRADHDDDQREHIQHDDCLPPHRFVLLCARKWCKGGLFLARGRYGRT